MNSLRLVTQVDLDFCGIPFHQPTLKEIAEGFDKEEDFFGILQLFHIDLKELTEMSEEIDSFQIFLSIFYSSDIDNNRKNMLSKFLNMIFKDCNISIGDSEIIITHQNNICILNSTNFEQLRTYVQTVFVTKQILDSEEEEFGKAASAAAKRIQEKLKERHKKLAQQKGQEERNTPILENYLSILSVGLHLDILNLMNLTMYNLFELLNRYNLKISWDIDLKCRLAGGGDKESQPENWMKMF